MTSELNIPDGVFPLTEREGKELGQMGWQSGHGWQDTPDWYHEPSNGPLIFIDEDARWLAKFCEDLAVIRREHAEKQMRASGVRLYHALAAILPPFQPHFHREDLQCAWCEAYAALAEARGEPLDTAT